MEKLLLTGEPGVGKSTLINNIYSLHPQSITGITANEIRDDENKRIGFTSGTFEKPGLYIIAHADIESEFRVSRYGVSVESLDSLAILLAQQATNAQENSLTLIFDEIGLMQAFSPALRAQIEDVINSDLRAIFTIKNDDSASEWIQQIKENPNVRLITLTPANREQVREELLLYISSNS